MVCSQCGEALVVWSDRKYHHLVLRPEGEEHARERRGGISQVRLARCKRSCPKPESWGRSISRTGNSYAIKTI